MINNIHRSKGPRVALAHHWLHVLRGGERVLEQFALLFPEAPIYTLFHRRQKLTGFLENHAIHQSILGYLPAVERYYRSLLPLFPLALGSLRVSEPCDFILSCDASMVKGLSMKPTVKHCCYCCSPPRYLFDMQDAYVGGDDDPWGLRKAVLRLVTPYLQDADIDYARRVSSFVTLSDFIRERIERVYGRSAEIVEPPVRVDDFAVTGADQDFYLIVSALVPYKKVDLAIKACNMLKRKLVVIGEGPNFGNLARMAGPTISLLGARNFAVVKQAYESCSAFIFPMIEDFGITAVEAQAAGKPVIAVRRGAVRETVIEGETGVFFEEQEVDSLIEAILHFESKRREFDPQVARRNAERYRPSEFRRKLKGHLETSFPDFFSNYQWPV